MLARFVSEIKSDKIITTTGIFCDACKRTVHE
jgi:hypothetical protein